MDNWKIRIQYINKYEVKVDLTEKQAKNKFLKLKENMYNKKIVWCELVYNPIDEDEIIVDSFENETVKILGCEIIV